MVKSWLLLALLLPVLAHADGTVLVKETFDEKDLTQVANGKRVFWSSDASGSIQVVNDPTLAAGKAFKGHQIVGILPFVVLANSGDSIKVHFSFRLAGPITPTLRGFRLGLFEGGDPNNPWFYASGNGYRWNVSTGPNAVPATVAKETGGPGQKVLNGQDQTVLDQSSQPFTFNDTAKHTATIQLVHGDIGITISLAIDGKKWVYQSTDPLAPPTLSPTRFAIRSKANEFLFDDFSVEVKQSSGGI